jgi:hypothetical protein
MRRDAEAAGVARWHPKRSSDSHSFFLEQTSRPPHPRQATKPIKTNLEAPKYPLQIEIHTA